MSARCSFMYSVAVRRLLIFAVAAELAVPVILQASQASSSEQRILSFGTMAGVRGPFVGSAHPIRGIAGGGLPWKIGSAQGDLTNDGRLQVQVRGLVLVNRAPVP